MGLGKLLTGEADFRRLAELAADGSREKADLLVGDIYGDLSWLPDSDQTGKHHHINAGVDVPLDSKLTAANFANRRETPSKADKMAALSNMIAESAVLLTAQAAKLNHSEKVYFIGNTLTGNVSLKQGLMKYCGMIGLDAGFLANGEFSGALGAYLSI
ncbi:hypothetical protein ACQCVH_13155 [Bacillus infantis]|uniref:hypothetical protein n=1 Tax=Bacillus infantis TaxID=324767 RepID=UPI003CFAD49D